MAVGRGVRRGGRGRDAPRLPARRPVRAADAAPVRVAVQSGHRYVLGACETSSSAMYRGMGFSVLEERIVEPKPGWRFRSHLLYADAERVLCGRRLPDRAAMAAAIDFAGLGPRPEPADATRPRLRARGRRRAARRHHAAAGPARCRGARHPGGPHRAGGRSGRRGRRRAGRAARAARQGRAPRERAPGGALPRGRGRALLDGCEPAAFGTWVFYPWSRRLVHVLPEALHRELRLDRNRYAITADEQERLGRLRSPSPGLSVGRAVVIDAGARGHRRRAAAGRLRRARPLEPQPRHRRRRRRRRQQGRARRARGRRARPVHPRRRVPARGRGRDDRRVRRRRRRASSTSATASR